MIPEEALQLLLSKLDQCRIPYMVTGSFASNAHGVPRTTYDADVVIDAEKKSVKELLSTLAEEFYLSHEAAEEALAARSMFNVVHLKTGFKIDLILKKYRPFSHVEFERREEGGYLGQSRYFATAEDVILAKLEWSKLGDSEKQFLDALNVAKVRGESLDRTHLNKWGKELSVRELLERLFRELERFGQG